METTKIVCPDYSLFTMGKTLPRSSDNRMILPWD